MQYTIYRKRPKYRFFRDTSGCLRACLSIYRLCIVDVVAVSLFIENVERIAHAECLDLLFAYGSVQLDCVERAVY